MSTWLMMAPTQQASITHTHTHRLTVQLLATRPAAPLGSDTSSCSDADDNRLQTTTHTMPDDQKTEQGAKKAPCR